MLKKSYYWLLVIDCSVSKSKYVNPEINMTNLRKKISITIRKNISMKAVRKTLRKKGYNRRIVMKKAYISIKNREKPLQFSKIFVKCNEDF